MKTPLNTLAKLNLNEDENLLAASIINRFGDGQHPVADNDTIRGFSIHYLNDIMKRKEFIDNQPNLTEAGKQTLSDLNNKLVDVEILK